MQIYRSNEFINWVQSLKNKEAVRRVNTRIIRAESGNFGDSKSLGGGLYEMRIDFGAGFRLYYSQVGNQIYFLLIGGDKDTQSKDIAHAREIKVRLDGDKPWMT